MVTQMIGVGEQTGAMDAMLQKIADFYEDEVDAAVKDLLSALEPAMIVFLGVVVGGIVISMYMPLFTLIGKLSSSINTLNRRTAPGWNSGRAACRCFRASSRRCSSSNGECAPQTGGAACNVRKRFFTICTEYG